MTDITSTEVKRDRDIFYYRKRLKNRFFVRLAAFFAEESERTGITKTDIARRLKKDPAQISRWLSSPSNLTLDTLSDLLLALDAEADPPSIIRFRDRSIPNFAHPLIAEITGQDTNITPEYNIEAQTMPLYPTVISEITTTSGMITSNIKAVN